MRTSTILIALSALLLAACDNTARGISEDAQTNRQKAAAGAKDLGKGVNEAGQDIGAAVTLTPKIKLAIEADKMLNVPENLINVESTDERVRLVGHVTSAELKDRAGDLARTAMKDAKATQPLENNLEIKP